MPPASRIVPEMCWPMRLSRTGCHGTSWKPMPSSIMAKRPLASWVEPTSVPLTYSPDLAAVNFRPRSAAMAVPTRVISVRSRLAIKSFDTRIRPSILTEGVAHVLVGAQVGKLPPLLLGDQHPVEPGEAIGIHLPLELLRDLQLGLPAQFPGHNLAGALANAIGDIVAGDIEGLAVVGDAAHEDMGVRVAGVVVVDRGPVEPRAE